MFTLDDMRRLLSARPFVPFRLWMSDGGRVDVRTPEVVLPGRRFAIVGLLDPDAADRQVGGAESLQLLGECGDGSLLAALPAQDQSQAHRC